MPFLALAGPIAGALGASAATAATIGTVGSVAGAIGSGIMANNASNKANTALDQAARSSQVDIDKLNEQTKAIARQNALDSAALEEQLTPEVPQLRTAANRAVLSEVNDPTLSNLAKRLETTAGGSYNTPLLQAAIAKAYESLQLGGRLGIDQQNLVSRNAAATAGMVSPGSLRLGRDLQARDLGLSSLDLENQRLATAAALGQQELGLEQANSARDTTRAQLIASITGQRFGQNLSAAGFGESIDRPIVGLDPSAAANITGSNATNLSSVYTNKANIYGNSSNQWMQSAGNLAGNALLSYNRGTPYPNTFGSGYSPQPASFYGK